MFWKLSFSRFWHSMVRKIVSKALLTFLSMLLTYMTLTVLSCLNKIRGSIGLQSSISSCEHISFCSMNQWKQVNFGLMLHYRLKNVINSGLNYINEWHTSQSSRVSFSKFGVWWRKRSSALMSLVKHQLTR